MRLIFIQYYAAIEIFGALIIVVNFITTLSREHISVGMLRIFQNFYFRKVYLAE